MRLVLGHDVLDDENGVARVRDLATGAVHDVRVRRRVVDARFLEVSVPATHTPTFEVARDAAFIPVNRLPEVADRASAFTVLGSGKTAVDAVLWLLENDIDPERIRWVRPRDAYFHDREAFQALDLVVDALDGFATDAEVGARATNQTELVADLEQRGRLIRLDPAAPATMYRGAMLSTLEIDRVRQIADVVRLGYVSRIERDRLVLDQNELPAGGALHVDASAIGLRLVDPQPIFTAGRITLQQVRHNTPPFNAALLAWVEANRDDDEQKNRLCRPYPLPRSVDEWPRWSPRPGARREAGAANRSSRPGWDPRG